LPLPEKSSIIDPSELITPAGINYTIQHARLDPDLSDYAKQIAYIVHVYRTDPYLDYQDFLKLLESPPAKPELTEPPIFPPPEWL